MEQSWQVKYPYPSFKCYNLDYIGSVDHYLFSGLVRDTLGIFEFDRNLNIIRTRTTSDVCGKDQYFVAYHLRGDSLLAQCGSNILIGSWHSERLNFVCDGLILAVSSDRNYALLRSSGDDPATLSEVVCATGIVNRLPIDCFAVLHAAYSPDGRYIAFNERLNTLVLTIKLSIYDRLEEKTWRTKLIDEASFVWLGSK